MLSASVVMRRFSSHLFSLLSYNSSFLPLSPIVIFYNFASISLSVSRPHISNLLCVCDSSFIHWILNITMIGKIIDENTVRYV